METPILFPVNPDDFYAKIRSLVDETISRRLREQPLQVQPPPSGLVAHPLLSLKDVCALFKISKPTLYEWINHSKLKPYKIRGKVYFLQTDIQSLFEGIASAHQNTEPCTHP
jgi:predicted DNA-binding transcriptional regulator AlpA